MLRKKYFLLPLLMFSLFYTGSFVASAQNLRVDIDTLNSWRYLDDGFERDLSRGSTGHDVRALQYFLKEKGESVETDGSFGETTEQAVRSFQIKNDLLAHGVVTKELRDQVNEFMMEELCPDSESEEDFRYEPLSTTLGLPAGYVPPSLTRIDESIRAQGVICLDKEAADGLLAMTLAAKEDGKILHVTSGFRRFEVQESVLEGSLARNGALAYAGVARPGHSEHQLGLAVDLSGATNNFKGADVTFGTTPEGKWLQEHAHEYGFVMSYPEGKTYITGYMYEPWHYRYVGMRYAAMIHLLGLTPVELFSVAPR